jgi:FMN phosphatase YigB (HAD superfamily)
MMLTTSLIALAGSDDVDAGGRMDRVGVSDTRATGAPAAVLLDAGGVFVLPEHPRILGAFERAGWTPPASVLDAAHYRAVVGFSVEADAETDWAGCWLHYLEDYVEACGTPPEWRQEVHEHLDSEFADAALWSRAVEGSVDDLRVLAATGVRLGVVSNADGVMAERLRGLEVLQVGPGVGVPVECVVDSGAVGVMKPDPRIFRVALELLDLAPGRVWYVGDTPGIDVVGAWRAGIRPFLLDPLGLHAGARYERVTSLAEVAARIIAAGDDRFDLASARAAALEDRTAQWVGEFLEASGNVVLGAALAHQPHWWLGPLRVPLRALVRLAGPEDDIDWTIEPGEWEHDVGTMGESLDDGWEPPPLLSCVEDGALVIHDGNHRYEALKRSGAEAAWVLLWFDDPGERAEFAARIGVPVPGWG